MMLKTGGKNKLVKHQTSIRRIYATLTGIVILLYFQMMLTYWEPSLRPSQTYVLPVWIWFLRIIAAAMALLSGSLRRDKCSFLLIIYLILMFFRAFFAGGGYVFNEIVSDAILSGLWVFIACYGIGKNLNYKQLCLFLSTVGSAWTIGMTISSCVGIYAAWNNVHIFNLVEGAIWGILVNRLFMLYLPTVSGAILSLSILISITFVFTVKGRWKKMLFLLSAVIMFIALGLTDSRTSFVTISIGVAGMVTSTLFSKYPSSCKRLKWRKILISSCIFMVIFLCLTISLTKIPGLFNKLRTTGTVIIPKALAEGEKLGEDMVSSRGFTGSDLLSGRLEIWRAAFNYIFHDPTVMLFGTTKANAMAGINQILGEDMAHCHNTPLMIFLESGLIGLIIIILFVSRVIVSAFRLMLNQNIPLWLRLLPSFVLSMLIGELVECYLWLRAANLPIISFAFIIMGIINTYGEAKLKDMGAFV